MAHGVHVTTLHGLDGPAVTVSAINDWAEVVGTMSAGGGASSAFHWQLTRGLTVLPMPGGMSTMGSGVNNVGEVAITVATPSGSQAAVWPWSGAVRMLSLLSTFKRGPAAPACVARGINNGHLVVGTCFVPVLDEEAPTVWTASGRPDGLHEGGGSDGVPLEGFAYAISDAGFVSGGPDETSFSPMAFVFTPSNTLVSLASEENGSANTSWAALAVNDSGWAAGYSPIAAGNSCLRAVAWLRLFTLHDLGTCGAATGITDDAIVVGTATDTTGHASFAFVWTADSGLRRLPGLNATGTGETSSASAINRNHQIVGSITSSGAQHAVMWTLPPALTGMSAPTLASR